MGRRVYYRPQRYRSNALFGVSEPIVRIGNCNARLVDLSISGLACELITDGQGIDQGAIMPLQLWLRENKAFSARVEVVRSDAANSRIGVRFLDSVPEPAALRSLAQAQSAREAIREGAAVYDCVPLEYRSAIHDVVTMLTHWRNLLDSCEAELAALGADERGARLAELEEMSEKRLRLDWRRTHSRANESAEMILEGPVLGPSKRLTELLVTPLLFPSPIWLRAYQKPRGYPGDFELMNYMYDETRVGGSVYARIMHQLGREERLAATVRNRRDLLVRHIREAVVRSKSYAREEVRICSIGAGPARELEEFLLAGDLPVRVNIWLVDQDEDALAFAYERLRRASLLEADRIDIRCRFTSFRQLLSDVDLMRELSGQDLIYSAGLFDYLSTSIAQGLLRQLVSLLAQDGCLLIGNAAADTGIRWVPEFVLDWRLRYRTAAEMLELADALSVRTHIETKTDDSSAWHFLLVTRDG